MKFLTYASNSVQPRAVLLFLGTLGLGSIPALSTDSYPFDQTGGIERLLLTNTGVADELGRPVTELYDVKIDASTGVAEAALEAVLPIEQVDAFACASDDSRCYLFAKYEEGPFPSGGTLGVFHRATGSFQIVGDLLSATTGERIPEVVAAAQQPGANGLLLVGSMATEEIYSVDPVTALATSLGKITLPDGETVLNLSGGDMAFNAAGVWFLWTNLPTDVDDAPAGLYEIRQRVFGGFEALFLGVGQDGIDPDSQRFTGLAVRNNGVGNLVGSNRFDELHEQDGAGQDVAFYSMMRDGEPLGHVSGDMHHTFDCFFEANLERDELRAGDELAFSIRLVHNRPKTVEVPLRITVRDENGFEVVETVSEPIRFEWGTDLQSTVRFRLPQTVRSGAYTLETAFEDMRQGEAIATASFTVVD